MDMNPINDNIELKLPIIRILMVYSYCKVIAVDNLSEEKQAGFVTTRFSVEQLAIIDQKVCLLP
jgi:hypothetical protein